MDETVNPFVRANTDLGRPGLRTVPLRRDEALALLGRHAAEVERRTGVRPVALFGSVARDEATVTSDVDVLVEYVGRVGWTELARAQDYLEALFEAPVDLASWEELRPRVRPYVQPELRRVS